MFKLNLTSQKQIKETNLELLIKKAMNKIKTQDELQIAKYLPDGEFRMHHKTFLRLKKSEPNYLQEALENFLTMPSDPQILPKRPYKKRTSSKIFFSDSDIEKITALACKSGNQEILEMVLPGLSLSSIKKDLIDSIKNNQLREDLIESYRFLIVKSQANQLANA